MLLQNTPATFDGVVLAVIGRKIKELDRFADATGKLNHSTQKLSAYAAALRSIVDFELNTLGMSLLLRGQTAPPGLQAIHDKVAGFIGTAKRQMQLSTVFIDQAERDVFFMAAHIMVIGPMIPACLAAARIAPNVDRGLAVHA